MKQKPKRVLLWGPCDNVYWAWDLNAILVYAGKDLDWAITHLTSCGYEILPPNSYEAATIRDTMRRSGITL